LAGVRDSTFELDGRRETRHFQKSESSESSSPTKSVLFCQSSNEQNAAKKVIMVRLRGPAAAPRSLFFALVSLLLGYRVNCFVPEVPTAVACLSVRCVPNLSSPWLAKRYAQRTSSSTLHFQPWKEITEMLQQWDDVVDDFLFKRMGNGEVFYGQRKYKPSNRPNTEGQYNGMGLSDKTKIDIVRDLKEERLLERQQRRRLEQQQRQQQQAKNKK
jgi:hypothetical protein